MLDYKDIPPECINTLKKVQTVFPQAIIAGGALRDLDLGYKRTLKRFEHMKKKSRILLR